MTYKKAFFICAASALLLLSACGGAHRPLKPIKKEKAHFVQTKENVELRIRVLKARHCEKHLCGTPDKRQLCVPELLQCSIINNSDKPVSFTHSNVSLKILSKSDVLKYLKKRYMFFKGAALGLAIAIAIPLMTTATLAIWVAGTHPCNQLIILLPLYLGLYATVPIIVAGGATGYCVEGYKNTCISKEIRDKVLENITIDAGKTENMLLFAHELPEHFTLSLTREQASPITFDVVLAKMNGPICATKNKIQQKTNFKSKIKKGNL